MLTSDRSGLGERPVAPLRWGAVLALGALAVVGRADLDIGSPRAVGMAGAGVALAGEANGAARLNPALLGASSARFGLQWPVARWRFESVPSRDGRSLRGGFDAAALRPDRLGRYAAKLGDRATGTGGERVASLAVDGWAVGHREGVWATARPNAALESWVENGRDPARLTGRERLDAYGYALRSFEFSHGSRLPLPAASSAQVAVGATLRRVETRYSHRVVRSSDLGTEGSVPGPEMGGRDALAGEGWGLDVGLWGRSTAVPEWSAGLVVRDLAKPGSAVSASPPGDSPARATLDPFATSVDTGLAYQGGRGWAVALDVVDLTAARGPVEIRVGVEKRSGEIFALRAGYSSVTGFVVGGSVGAFSVVFRGRGPLALQTVFRF